MGRLPSLSHALLDDLISHVQTVRDRPVWQPAPATVRERFAQPLPHGERGLASVLADVRTHIVPYATGNLHPRFMGWVHGAGTPIGILAELVAAGLNMNCGGRDHIGIQVEKQIALWMAEALGLPSSASGVFLTGSSMANFAALTVAKVNACGPGIREQGLRQFACG